MRKRERKKDRIGRLKERKRQRDEEDNEYLCVLMRKREIGKERKRKKERERKRETVWALNSKRNFDKKFDFSYFPFCEKKASCVSD